MPKYKSESSFKYRNLKKVEDSIFNIRDGKGWIVSERKGVKVPIPKKIIDEIIPYIKAEGISEFYLFGSILVKTSRKNKGYRYCFQSKKGGLS